MRLFASSFATDPRREGTAFAAVGNGVYVCVCVCVCVHVQISSQRDELGMEFGQCVDCLDCCVENHATDIPAVTWCVFVCVPGYGPGLLS